MYPWVWPGLPYYSVVKDRWRLRTVLYFRTFEEPATQFLCLQIWAQEFTLNNLYTAQAHPEMVTDWSWNIAGGQGLLMVDLPFGDSW